MLIIIFFTYFLSVVSYMEELYSIAIRDNKLIGIYLDYQTKRAKARVYELKDGLLSDISHNGKVFDLDYFQEWFELKIFDASDSLQEDKNKIWLRYELQGFNYSNKTSPFMNYVQYIDLDDMSLKNGTSFKFPKDEKFPLQDYTVNKIMNERESALYITGGSVYLKKDRSFDVTNSFYKYSFSSKEWVDMAYSINGKLKPLYNHKSVVFDNRYLVILGGKRPIAYYGSDIVNVTLPTDEYNSIYNLTVFDTFTNSWENINIKPDVFDTSVATVQFDQFIAAAYNDKIILLGGYTAENGANNYDINKYFGILDFRSKNWTWVPILNEDGSKYNSNAIHKEFLIFNDQLIIFSDYIRGEKEMPFKVYDMLSQRMKSTLRLSNELNTTNSGNEISGATYQDKSLPAYAIFLIVLGCIALLLALIYLLYTKNKKKSSSKDGKIKYNGPIREVWANPELHNALNIITGDKRNDFDIGKNTSNVLGYNTGNSYKQDMIEFEK